MVSYALLLTIIGILAIGIVQLFRGSKGRTVRVWGTWIGIIVAIIGIVAVMSPNALPAFQTTFSISGATLATAPIEGGADQGAEEDIGIAVCPKETTTVTLSAQDKYVSTASGGTHRYRICNGGSCAPAKTVADAGTFTANPGDILEVLWMNGSLTSYFSQKETYVIPCSGAKTFYANLVVNGTLDMKIFNSNGDVQSTGLGNETLTAGDVKTLKLEVAQQYNKGFPNGVVAVIEYNKTAFDDITLLSNGVELASASVPQSHSPLLGIASSRKAYTLPAMESNKPQIYSLVLDVDDTYNPTAENDSGATIDFYGKNYFINDKNGGAFEGPVVEDEYNAVTRTGFDHTRIWVA